MVVEPEEIIGAWKRGIEASKTFAKQDSAAARHTRLHTRITLDGMEFIPPPEAQELADARGRVHVRPVRGRARHSTGAKLRHALQQPAICEYTLSRQGLSRRW